MTTGTFTDQKVNAWLAEISQGCFLGLHFDNPSTAGAYASEYSGDGYTRKPVVFSLVSSRVMWNGLDLVFAGLDAGTVTYLGGWNARVLGDLDFQVRLVNPKRIVRGGGYTVPTGQLVVSVA